MAYKDHLKSVPELPEKINSKKKRPRSIAVVDEDKPECKPVILQLSKTKNPSNDITMQDQCTE